MSNILKYQNPSSPLLTSNDPITDDNYNEKVQEMYRLRAESDSLGERYTKANSLGEKIAEYTLNKYKDYRGSAIHYGKWAGTSKPYENEDINFLFDSNIRLEDNGIVDFLKSYANSEGFNRIRNNQLNWWKARHPRKKYLYPGELYDKKQIKYYKNNISHAEKSINYVLDGYPELSFSIPEKSVTYTFKPWYGEDTKRPFNYSQMHEFAHLFNYPASTSNTINAEVLDQNTNTKKNDHDEYLHEKHSDNIGVKYLLFKEGIYDARGDKDITPEQVQQLRNKYPKLRFLQQLNNEDAAFQINHVAQNTTDQNRIDYKDPITFAKKGGRIHIKKKNRGKFTEYCGEKVTEECIAKGKKSKDPKIRKRATFAANARKWKHENGGILKYQNPSSPLLNTGYKKYDGDDLLDVETFNKNWLNYRNEQLAKQGWKDDTIKNKLNWFQHNFGASDKTIANLVREQLFSNLDNTKELSFSDALKDSQGRYLLTESMYSNFPGERKLHEVEVGPPKPVEDWKLDYSFNESVKGINYPDFNTIIYNNLYQNTPTKIHERDHAMFGQYDDKNIGLKIVDNIFKQEFLDNVVDKWGYYDDPEEIRARLMQMRYNNQLDPNHKYTFDEIENMRNDSTFIDEHIFDRYTNKYIEYLLNDVAQNTINKNRLDYKSPINFAKNGGILKALDYANYITKKPAY